MATVVREIERKYDPAEGGTAALDAVKAMTGTAGIAAVSQQGEQLLDAVLLRHRGSAADRCRHHAAAAHRRRGCGLAPETARGRGHPGRDTPAAGRARRQAGGNAPRQDGRRGTGGARRFGPGLYPGRGAGAGGAHPDQPPRARGCSTAPARHSPRSPPTTCRPSRPMDRRRLVGRDRGRAGHRRPRTADGDRRHSCAGRAPGPPPPRRNCSGRSTAGCPPPGPRSNRR